MEALCIYAQCHSPSSMKSSSATSQEHVLYRMTPITLGAPHHNAIVGEGVDSVGGC